MPSVVRSSVITTALIAAVATLSGCSGIRVVKASKAGGEIALLGNREEAMTKATMEMNRMCGPSGFNIVEEGETVIGTHSTSSGQTTAGHTFFGAPATRSSGTTDTIEKTEWRVKYTCNGAAQPPTPAPAPAPMPGAKIHELVVRF